LDRHGRRIGPVWLSVSQLGRRWQLSRKTIYKFIDARILPAWKVGRHLYRIALEDVLRFEAQPRGGSPHGSRFVSPKED
jgi:excisionase family DNA binding protein